MSQQAAIELITDEATANRRFAPEPHLAAVSETAAPAVDLAAVTMHACPPHSVWTTQARQRRILAMADVTAMTCASLAALGHFGTGLAAAVALGGMPLLVVAFKIAGLYDREELRLGHTTLDEVPLLAQLTGLLALALAILLPAFGVRGLHSLEMAMLWVVLFVALVTGRMVARAIAGMVVPVERCLVLGEVRHAQRIRQRISASGARVAVVACLGGEEFRKLGGPGVIRDLVHELGVHRIIIAPVGAGDCDGAVEQIRMAKAVGVRVSVLPRILEVVGAAAAFDEVEGMGLLGVPRFGLARSSRLLKRGLDLAVTAVALFILGPLLLAITIAIRLDSRGPIFFRQQRVGRGGEHFSILKFRSMVADAESLKEELRALSIAGTGLFKVPDDPRVTRLGRFLRRSSLDELPQLFNVLRGEMSLVGPRPLVCDEDAQVLGLDRSRLRLKPGMTGPWQLQRTRVPLCEMVEIDYLYASNWSLWLDLKIMLRTVQHVARRGNL